MIIFPHVETFLQRHCPQSSEPLLLALSGGPDSLCLFHCLLIYRQRYGISIHVAHVDHGWRQESQMEAQILQQLASNHQVPFHLKTLNPSILKGNLEAVCRQERYAFFAELNQHYRFQGILTGHHENDQAETIFKRILEGAHWSRWTGLKSESWMDHMRILRPLLTIPKQAIQQALAQEEIQAFVDSTNKDLHYLRARLRENIFPWLNQSFGKEVQTSFIKIGEDAQELIHYFDQRLGPLLDVQLQGPWGICVDLQHTLPHCLLEIKYLLRLLCKQQGFFLSRSIIEHAALALQTGRAHQLFAIGSHQLRIDRRRIFILSHSLRKEENHCLDIAPGTYQMGMWTLGITEEIYSPFYCMTSWKEAWQGGLKGYIPQGDYTLGFKKELKEETSNGAAIKKRWSQAKVPAFLYPYFPLIWQRSQRESSICHEFLTGKLLLPLKEGDPCWGVSLDLRN